MTQVSDKLVEACSTRVKRRSFLGARAFARTLNFKNSTGWVEFAKSEKRPRDIPSSPQIFYKDEWVSWDDWLGRKDRQRLDSYAAMLKSSDWLKNAAEGTEDFEDLCFIRDEVDRLSKELGMASPQIEEKPNDTSN